MTNRKIHDLIVVYYQSSKVAHMQKEFLPRISIYVCKYGGPYIIWELNGFSWLEDDYGQA